MEKTGFLTINGYKHVRYHPEKIDVATSLKKANEYFDWISSRRSIRHFSERKVSRKVIEKLILSASTAPSGANKQPWTFCAISNPQIKSKIRIAAELEEKENYENRMSERWKKDLAPLGTDMHKPFLEEAPWLIVLFKRIYEIDEYGIKYNNYYVNESVGIAAGMLITAIHNAGLVTLTHTPSPMNFLAKILDRPDNERPYILFPVGYPAEEVYVPDIGRKAAEEISIFFE